MQCINSRTQILSLERWTLVTLNKGQIGVVLRATVPHFNQDTNIVMCVWFMLEKLSSLPENVLQY